MHRQRRQRGHSISVPAGNFDDADDKYYVPGIGIAVDAAAELTSFTPPE
jgi:hypothetical protein